MFTVRQSVAHCDTTTMRQSTSYFTAYVTHSALSPLSLRFLLAAPMLISCATALRALHLVEIHSVASARRRDRCCPYTLSSTCSESDSKPCCCTELEHVEHSERTARSGTRESGEPSEPTDLLRPSEAF